MLKELKQPLKERFGAMFFIEDFIGHRVYVATEDVIRPNRRPLVEKEKIAI